LNFRRSIRREEPEINFIPLIDLLLVILIFLMVTTTYNRYRELAVDLPADFALNQPLAPFALAAMDLLNVEAPEHTVDVVSVVEATLDDPRPLLHAQQRAARGEAIAAMKAEGMDYEERMAALEEVTWPQPLAELLTPALEMYKQANPWIAEHELAPKSVVREMVENAMTFSDLISRYELGRSEGVVLRYLTDAYRALRQVVPEEHRTPEVTELIDWLGALVRAVDSSLLDEWEALGQAQAGKAGEMAGLLEGDRPGADDSAGVERAFGAGEDGTVAFTRNRHAFRVAVRREMFRRAELMARDDVEALGRLDASSGWGEDRWDEVLGRYWDEYDWIGTDTSARAISLAPLDEAPDETALAAAGVSERLREALGPAVGGIPQHALTQYLATGALRRRTQRLRRVYRRRRNLITSLLADAPGCHLRPITGGLHAVLLCDAPAHQVVDACRRSGIQVTALHDYWGGQGEENGIVFGFGCHDDDTLDWAVNEIKYCVSCL